ncbi:MAG TPA: TonB family protein [Polyangiaceae bacterium]|nr:TonB family protein [Polyangiaceae bacterium]
MSRLVIATLLFLAQLTAGGSAAAQSPASSADIDPPRAISTPLAYPETASGAATLLLELTVDRSGRVVDARVVEGDPEFQAAALSAAQTWRFEPARRRGEAIAARIRYSVQFTPQLTEPSAKPAEVPTPKLPAAKVPATPASADPAAAIEITVQGKRAPPGSVLLTREETRALPGTFGDPLRSIEAQPGVVPIVSGLPAFFIRGAPPANVGFFFDGIELPLLYHAFFGPSVIHPGFIDTIEFYPGAAPAQYGRFAGPIVAVNSRPLRGQAGAEANLRLIDAGGLVESGPLSDCRGAANIACSGGGARAAGRYSYAGVMLSLLSDAKLNYWDYQTQASYPIGPKDELGILAFGAYDLFRAPQASVNTGAELTFHRIDVRWDRKLGAGSSLRLALTGGYDRAAGADAQTSIVTNRSLRLRSEFSQRLAPGATLHAGLDVRLDRFGLEADPRNLNFIDFARLFPARTDSTAGGYLSFQLQAARGIRVSPGLRADLYTSQGVTKVGVDPRISAEFDISRTVRMDHSIGIAHQRPNFAAQVPGAQVADLSSGLQWALLWSSGVRVRLPAELTASATVFRSAYFHALDPIGGARDFAIDQSALNRRATISAAGLELRLERPLRQRVGGFISYTLSRTEESIGTTKGPSGFDRPHIFQAALSYDLGRGFVVGARTVVYSGVPELNLEGAPHFTSARRGSPFFRLDLRAEKRFRLGRNGYWGVIAEILNATSSKEVVRLDCGELCRERSAGPVILPSLGIQAGI